MFNTKNINTNQALNNQTTFGLAIMPENLVEMQDVDKTISGSLVDIIVITGNNYKRVKNVLWGFSPPAENCLTTGSPDGSIPAKTIGWYGDFVNYYTDKIALAMQNDTPPTEYYVILRLGAIADKLQKPCRIVEVTFRNGDFNHATISGLYERGEPVQLDIPKVPNDSGEFSSSFGSQGSQSVGTEFKKRDLTSRLDNISQPLSTTINKNTQTKRQNTTIIADNMYSNSLDMGVVTDSGKMIIGGKGVGIVIDTESKSISFTGSTSISMNTSNLKWNGAPFNDNLVSNNVSTDYWDESGITKHELYARQELISAGSLGLLPAIAGIASIKLVQSLSLYGTSPAGYSLNTIVAAMGFMEAAPFTDIVSKIMMTNVDAMTDVPHLSSYSIEFGASSKFAKLSKSVPALYLNPINGMDSLILAQHTLKQNEIVQSDVPAILSEPEIPVTLNPTGYEYGVLFPGSDALLLTKYSNLSLSPETILSLSPETMECMKVMIKASEEMSIAASTTKDPAPIPMAAALETIISQIYIAFFENMTHTHITHRSDEFHVGPRMFKTYPIQEVFKSRQLERMRQMATIIKKATTAVPSVTAV